ncbi:MAG TPA: hypothetical protein VFF30_05160 [Nitrososphaerales archaeon]|nr:hypothetical protein [Nitrososphaerales archaeon]
MAFQNFYGKKLTVLVVALLLVFSSFTFLPALAYKGGAATNAVISSPSAQNASPPSLSASPNAIIGTNASAFTVKVTNPASNIYAITSITIVAPTGWTFAGSATCGTVALKAPGAVSGGAVQCTAGTGSGLPPGFSDTLALGTLQGATSAPSPTQPPIQGTFTSLVIDAGSGSASYAGSSFTEWDVASTNVVVTLSPNTTPFTAGGSPYTVTATLGSGQAGVPIVWSFSNSLYPSSGFTATLSPSSSVTTTGGTTSTTFTPSNHAPDATTVVATIGTSAESGASASVATQAGAPSKVSFYFTAGNPKATYATDYLGNSTTISSTLYAETYPSGTSEVSLSLSDAFANPVAFSASITNITLTGVGGQFNSGGNLFSTISCGTVVAGNSHFTCPASGNNLPLPFTYLQSSTYGTIGEIAASIFISSSTYTGSSGNLVTSTLGTLGQTGPTTATNVAAGSSVLVQSKLSVAQSGVPITLNLCTSSGCATSAGYHGVFSNGQPTITLTSNSSGGVEALMAVNTTANSVAYFNATAVDPQTTSASNIILGAVSAQVKTIPGSIATLVVNIAANAPPSTGPNIQYAVAGATAYVDLAYADAYNNLVTTAPSNQIQIALSASSGALSATNVYIGANQLSTNASFGAILWTLTSSVGTTATITASANVNGKAVVGTASIMTVSASPTIAVSNPAPISGIAYSNTAFVTFKGTANATLGSASTNIASIGYKVGTGAWQSISTASLHNVVWTVPIVLASGLNTVTFNTTDSKGVTTAIAPLTVLVDTNAPTFGNITLCSCGTEASVAVNDSLGDLNATSVQAWINGTAVSSSQISVSGINNPGSAVNYTVTVSGLTTGTWSIKVSASDLAGNTASTTGTVTVVVVPPPLSSTFVIKSATPGSSPVGPAINATITNNGAATYTAYVYVVVHSASGATVYIGVANFGAVAAGSSASLTIPVVLAPGTYSATVYVDTPSGVAVAQPQQVTITIS